MVKHKHKHTQTQKNKRKLRKIKCTDLRIQLTLYKDEYYLIPLHYVKI